MVCHRARHRGFSAYPPAQKTSRRSLSRLLAGVVGVLCCSSALAQPADRAVPNQAYFAAFGPFYDGEYRDAMRVFSDAARHAIKTPQARWIDSICHETMLGECCYQTAAYDEALEHYTAAIRLYISYADWMLRVQFPPIQPSAQVPATPWGASTRGARLGRYPTTMLVQQGRLNNMDVLRHGGVVQPLQLFPVNVQEIVRATTLAIRRRATLLGPTSAYDPVTTELLAALAQRPGPPNHWSEAWINVPLGLAYLAAGKEAQGIAALKTGILAAGEFDHPLTSVALLELGRHAMKSGDFPAALKYFEEASYAAFHYPDAGILEEAFYYGAVTHLMANRPGVFPPLAAAAQWAKTKGLRQFQASLLLSAAENALVLGQTPPAAALLEEARTVIGRRQMGSARIGARLAFLDGLLFFRQNRIAQGDAAIAAAMRFMERGSLWLFHISLVDNLVLKGMDGRLGLAWYRDVLRDPTTADWLYDPMESLAVLCMQHLPAYEHWFELAVGRKDYQTALEVAERSRRHRFFASLPYGGRLHSLRWVLEAPPELLDKESLLHRRDLLARYPAYAQLAQQVGQLRRALLALPLAPPDADTLKQQSQALGQLAALSSQQETILREMAVRREPGGLVFPPLRAVREVQKSLPAGHAAWVFFATNRGLYSFLLNREKDGFWQVASPQLLSKQIVGFLRDIGQYQPNHELTPKELADTRWKQSAAQVLETLLKGSQADFTERFEELIIVPDGALWYLPFEALQVQVGGQWQPLIARVKIRYVPTFSLAAPLLGPRTPLGATAVVAGKLYPRDEATVSQQACAQMEAVLPGTTALKTPLPAPSSIYCALFNSLIVFDDLNNAAVAPYDLALVPLERNKPGNTLGDWFALPWGGPDAVILPGFHTHAEEAPKRLGPRATGHEVFLTVCGLLSNGARTVLLSRWRTAGESSYTLVREFAQELPHTPAPEAWQRAVFIVADAPLNFAAEPRVKATASDEPLKASHPLFWAGYMLVDLGTLPAHQQPAEPAVIKEKIEQPK